jgi:hypothetical protein
MKSFKAVQGSELRWIQSSRLESKLMTWENEVVASLAWKTSWGSFATGESAEGTWTIKRGGFLHPRITVREAGSDSNMGVISMSPGGTGTLTFTSGSVYLLEKFKGGLGVLDSKRKRILLLKPLWSTRNVEALVSFDDKDDQENLSLLAILCWYVIFLVSNYDNNAAFVAALTAIM